MTPPPPSVDAMNWWQYVQEVSGKATTTEVANKMGLTQPSVGRWAKGTNGPDARQAVSFARAYGMPPLGALVAAGFLTPEEAKQRPTELPTLDHLTGNDLIEEIKKRLARAEAALAKQQEEDQDDEPFLKLAARKTDEPKGYIDPYPDEGC